MSARYVRVYNPRTHKLTRIPERELSSEMVCADVEGIKGRVWIDKALLKVNRQPQHPAFPAEVRAMLVELRKTFAEVYPQTLQGWEDGFRADAHPEREIALWLHMAEAYKHFASDPDLDLGTKREIFQVILAAVNVGSAEAVLMTFAPEMLCREEVLEIATYVLGQSDG